MQLTLESGKTIADPTDGEVAQYLPVEQFAILSDGQDGNTYMQFAQGEKLTLEYQVDSTDN